MKASYVNKIIYSNYIDNFNLKYSRGEIYYLKLEEDLQLSVTIHTI